MLRQRARTGFKAVLRRAHGKRRADRLPVHHSFHGQSAGSGGHQSRYDNLSLFVRRLFPFGQAAEIVAGRERHLRIGQRLTIGFQRENDLLLLVLRQRARTGFKAVLRRRDL